MRKILCGILILCASLAGFSSARAGVYLSRETPFLPESNALGYLGDLRGIPVPTPLSGSSDAGSQWAIYRARTAELEDLERIGALNTLDRIDLGACYIRLRRFGDALRVLKGADQGHFLVLANLATAFFESGELDLALRYQEQALRAWPPVWAAWNMGAWIRYRRCELLFKRLLEGRLAEQRLSGGRAGPIRSVDPLFPRVRFAGASGQYEAGPLPRMWDDLPPDAHLLVLQLVAWLPYDDRLTWLYAELLNSRGQVAEAAQLVRELVDVRRIDAAELKQHRQVLLQGAREHQELTLPRVHGLLWALAPRGLPGVPALGTVAVECGWPGAYLEDQVRQDPLARLSPAAGGNAVSGMHKAANGGGDDPGSGGRPAWLPNFRDLGVGFGLGVFLTVLALLQWRQSVRHRAVRAPQAPTPG
jgi:tetratricopeptide (TPR) repeat protein